jgi:hypothetical protein
MGEDPACFLVKLKMMASGIKSKRTDEKISKNFPKKLIKIPNHEETIRQKNPHQKFSFILSANEILIRN